MRCAIWYHLYNLKNLKNTHGGVLILVKLQAEALKLTLLHWCFSRFLNCTNGNKLRNAPQICQNGTETLQTAKIYEYSTTLYHVFGTFISVNSS